MTATFDGTYLHDADALAVIRAVDKINCRKLLNVNADRVVHFARRMDEREDDPSSVVIVILNVDDVHGGPLADALIPSGGPAWQEARDRGELPVARGLAGRSGIQDAVDLFDEEAGNKLRHIAGKVAVVVTHGVADVYEVP